MNGGAEPTAQVDAASAAPVKAAKPRAKARGKGIRHKTLRSRRPNS
jgi:hypothetical protein